jgi:hypothetical protein
VGGAPPAPAAAVGPIAPAAGPPPVGAPVPAPGAAAEGGPVGPSPVEDTAGAPSECTKPTTGSDGPTLRGTYAPTPAAHTDRRSSSRWARTAGGHEADGGAKGRLKGAAAGLGSAPHPGAGVRCSVSTSDMPPVQPASPPADSWGRVRCCPPPSDTVGTRRPPRSRPPGRSWTRSGLPARRSNSRRQTQPVPPDPA